MEEFELRSRELDARVSSLCASGKRKEAQQEAMAYGQELARDPDIQKMTKCSQMMRGMMPEMPNMNQANVPDTSVRHVCD
jgi:hypothetical protein